MVVLPLVAVLFLLGCAEQGEVARDRTLVIAHPTGGLNQIVDYDSFNPSMPGARAPGATFSTSPSTSTTSNRTR